MVVRRLRRGGLVSRANRLVSISDVLNWLGVPAPTAPPVSIKVTCPFVETHPADRQGEKDMRLYPDNHTFCFTGDTRFITRDGVRQLQDCVGSSQWVLTPGPRFSGWGRGVEGTRFDGVWEESLISSFGVQKVLRVTLRRSKLTKVIRATPNHRWVASSYVGGSGDFNIVETKDLRPGTCLASLSSKVRIYDGACPSPFGVAHGFVFGDGSLSNDGARVTLWGEKDSSLLQFFSGCPSHPVTSLGGVSGTTINCLPKYFKSFPSLDEGTTYLYGWLAGYLAADGSVSDTGKVFIESSVRENIEFARTVATRLGIPTYSITESSRVGFGAEPAPMYRMHFVASRVPAELLLIKEHRRRFESYRTSGNRLRWTVVSVEDLGEEEEVFCATVPRTSVFTLEDSILTGNCHICQVQYTPVKLAAQAWSLSSMEAARAVLARAGLELTGDEELESLLSAPTAEQLRTGAVAALGWWADRRGVDRFSPAYTRCLQLADQIAEPEHVDMWLAACKDYLGGQDSHAKD